MKKCPICSHFAKDVFDINGFMVSECGACTHRFTLTDVRQLYDDAYFFDGGIGYPNYLLEGEIITKHAEQYAQKIKPAGSLLDIGCAAGFIMQGFKNHGWDVKGIEPNATMGKFGREHLNLSIETTSVENYITDQQFDLITLIQVIAHLPNPAKIVQQLTKWVKPGGHIQVETWNWQSLPAKILGKYWHEYSPPSVLHWFTPKSLNTLFAEFEVVSTGRPKKKIQGEHIKSLIREKYNFNLPIPDHTVFPYPSFDLFYTLYKKRS